MLDVINWSLLSPKEQRDCLVRPTQTPSIRTAVTAIIEQVQSQGDDALYSLTQQFDGIQLSTLCVPRNKIQEATINQKALSAIKHAIETITFYHKALIPEHNTLSTAPGVSITTTYRPIQKVGLYVPGGNNTPLISSLLMQAIPALVAGCPIKVLCTPPNAQGDVDPHLLVAARLCGIDTVYCLGGAQAIAAMAYGTESVTKVDKLFGPGNSYVTEAKTLVAMDPAGAAIDMPAGPSEVMISADRTANPAFIAADLLAQAEHGPDSQVFLLCDDKTTAEQVNQQLNEQLATLSRAAIAQSSLAKSKTIICPNQAEQIAIVNAYAPEHLILNRVDAATWVHHINAAGTVFVGPWAAETLGDYITGSNHVLPTHGFAKCYNGLNTLDFLTRFTIQTVTAQGIKNLGPTAVTLAQIEGLDAHAKAVQIRLNELEV
jgi:histidinol dehydrogenase